MHMHMHMRRTSFGFALAVAILLAACAPSVEERVGVQQLTEPVTFYPHQTGARWEYLPDGARVSDPRLVQTVEGPTVLDGEVWIAWRIAGRGSNLTSFRQTRADGVFLKQRVRPGTVITFDPPIQEFPAQSELRVGAIWSGETTANLTFSEAEPGNQTATLELSYTYTVVDRRTVTLLAGEFEVFVVNLVSRTFDENGGIVEELQQATWFSPFVGEVRTDNEYFLVASNVLPDAPEEDGS